jgi:hypothetical protein
LTSPFRDRLQTKGPLFPSSKSIVLLLLRRILLYLRAKARRPRRLHTGRLLLLGPCDEAGLLKIGERGKKESSNGIAPGFRQEEGTGDREIKGKGRTSGRGPVRHGTKKKKGKRKCLPLPPASQTSGRHRQEKEKRKVHLCFSFSAGIKQTLRNRPQSVHFSSAGYEKDVCVFASLCFGLGSCPFIIHHSLRPFHRYPFRLLLRCDLDPCPSPGLFRVFCQLLLLFFRPF